MEAGAVNISFQNESKPLIHSKNLDMQYVCIPLPVQVDRNKSFYYLLHLLTHTPSPGDGMEVPIKRFPRWHLPILPKDESSIEMPPSHRLLVIKWNIMGRS